jgi:asparagine synthase (glutamine-hydrolysing)
MCGIFGYLKKKGCVSVKDRRILLSQFIKTQHRGPEHTVFKNVTDNIVLGFHRLRIVNIKHGIQPFQNEEETLFCICNGEIYNHKELRVKHELNTKTESDCEVILSLYKKYGDAEIDKLIAELDGVYAFCIVDIRDIKPKIIIARDPHGIRSLYYASDTNETYIASEMKSIPRHMHEHTIHFPAGHYSINGDIKKNKYVWCEEYFQMHANKYLHLKKNYEPDKFQIQKSVRNSFEKAVEKRFMSDRPIGCLLSGGLDSSLVSALVAKKLAPQRIHTFSIGMEGATDLKYARMVADHIHSIHHEVIVSKEDMLDAIPEVIYHIESWDETTVLASTPMYLLCKYIQEETDIKVVYTGEGADELSGSYMYFHNAPNLKEFQNETCRLVKDLEYFDVLRCEKCIAAHGLEGRVPFLDRDFVSLYNGLHPVFKSPKYNERNGRPVEKYMLRHIFDDGLLPEEVLWRVKEAFSNGCSSIENDWHAMVNKHCDGMEFDDDVLKSGREEIRPHSKKGAYFRAIYMEHFENLDLIPYYWVPKWSGDTKDSSARTLNVYKNLIE